MNNKAKYILMGLGGVVVGAMGGVFGAKGYFEEKANEEIKSVKEIYNRKPDPKKFAEELAAIELEAQAIVEEKSTEAEEGAKVDINDKQFATYEKLVRNESYLPKAEKEAQESEERSTMEEYDVKEESDESLYGVISEAQFESDHFDYDKITLNWWPDVSILTDDAGTIVDEAGKLFNPNVLDLFGNDPDNPDILYVRNHEREVDFEITRDVGSPLD